MFSSARACHYSDIDSSCIGLSDIQMQMVNSTKIFGFACLYCSLPSTLYTRLHLHQSILFTSMTLLISICNVHTRLYGWHLCPVPAALRAPSRLVQAWRVARSLSHLLAVTWPRCLFHSSPVWASRAEMQLINSTHLFSLHRNFIIPWTLKPVAISKTQTWPF